MRYDRALVLVVPRVSAVLLVLSVLVGCGKKGAPLPPLRIAPGAIKDFQAHRSADSVTLRLTVPAANQDGSVPPFVERVEIYAASPAAGAAAPTAAELLNDANRISTIEVTPKGAKTTEGTKDTKDAKGAKDAKAGPPAPGEIATFVDKSVAAAIGKADAPARYYLAVAVAGRNRRGVPSAVVAVPMGAAPAAPAGLAIDYDETAMTLSWTAAANRVVLVEEITTDAAGVASRRTMTPKPLAASSWSLPTDFSRQRCFAIRGIETAGAASIEGGLGEPVCVTAVDRFPPAAPEGLVAIPGSGEVQLSWVAVDAPDLAGYTLLRADATGGNIQALMKAPTAATSYRDATVTAGVTYTYFVVALDKVGNPSPRSNSATVTAR